MEAHLYQTVVVLDAYRDEGAQNKVVPSYVALEMAPDVDPEVDLCADLENVPDAFPVEVLCVGQGEVLCVDRLCAPLMVTPYVILGEVPCVGLGEVPCVGLGEVPYVDLGEVLCVGPGEVPYGDLGEVLCVGLEEDPYDALEEVLCMVPLGVFLRVLPCVILGEALCAVQPAVPCVALGEVPCVDQGEVPCVHQGEILYVAPEDVAPDSALVAPEMKR